MMCHNAMINILRDFSPKVQVYSIDEAFLDYTGMQAVHGDPVSAAYKLKNRIKNELGFTVNVLFLPINYSLRWQVNLRSPIWFIPFS